MDNNIDGGGNEADNHHPRGVEQAEERRRLEVRREQQMIANDARRLNMLSVLERKEEYPLRTRSKIDELLQEVIDNFLEQIRDDVHDMLCEKNDSDNYRGLDSDRDTEEEVEAIVRLFPDVLSRRSRRGRGREGITYYPIQMPPIRYNGGALRCNVKAISFIPLLARLAIEFGLFEEQYRGGLFCQSINGGYTTLQNLMRSDIRRHNEPVDENHNELVDDKYLLVLIQLRKMGLLKKEDIQRYDLLNRLCGEYQYSAEKRFRFLVEWDPTALLHSNRYERLPIECAAYHSSVRAFRSVFEAGIRYYPKQKGTSILFKNDDIDETPFRYACIRHGHDEVMEVVENTLGHSSSPSDNTQPLNIMHALVTAAIDEGVHLDCVYFLLRRHPDVLKEQVLPLQHKSKLRKRKREDHNNQMI